MNPREPERTARPGEDAAIGLCYRCRHARRVPTSRAVYWLCGRSATDPRFDKYPRLPVLACPGYEAGEPA